jgi:hypothetical protein
VKNVLTDDDTIVFQADFFRQGDGDHASFTAKVFLSAQDEDPELPASRTSGSRASAATRRSSTSTRRRPAMNARSAFASVLLLVLAAPGVATAAWPPVGRPMVTAPGKALPRHLRHQRAQHRELLGRREREILREGFASGLGHGRRQVAGQWTRAQPLVG